MKYEVPMPSLGADMDSGKLMEWKIAVDDDVKKGATLALVETTKSVVEIECYHPGKVLELIAKTGEVIEVGKPIAVFEVEEAIGAEVKGPEFKKTRVKISPAALKFAQENHISVETLIGSGPEGQIELKDVESRLVKSSREGSRVNIRQAIAQAMSLSKKEIPHYYLKTQVDLTKLLSWMDAQNEQRSPEQRFLAPVLILRAAILALKDFPMFNGHFQHGVFVANPEIHFSTAIALKSGGVLVPALLSAQSYSLDELHQKFLDLVKRTQSSQLKNRELTEGTVTVTNLGDLGVDEVFGIIFPPQVALIGMGAIRERPVIVNKLVTTAWVIQVSLSADHRVTDGLTGARFLKKIDELLQKPENL